MAPEDFFTRDQGNLKISSATIQLLLLLESSAEGNI